LKTNSNIENLRKNHLNVLSDSQIAEEHFQLSLIINNSEEFLLLINRDYEIIICNHILKRMVKERINITLKPGDDMFCMVSPDEKERVRNFCDRAFEGETVEFEYSVDWAENNTYYFHCIYKPAVNSEGEITAVVIISKDITEKKKAYLALSESEQRWRFALEGSNQGVWDWNIETNEVYFSPSWKKMLGYNESEFLSNMAEWEKLIHPADKERMTGHIEKHLHSQNPYYETEFRLKAADGSYKCILARGMIFKRSEDERPSRMIGTHTDITERKKVEENYKLLFYDNPMPMWTYERTTFRFLNVNNAAINHYGYTRKEFLEMSLFDIRPKEDEQKLKRFIQNGENKNLPHQNIWRHKKKNGDIIYVNVAVQAFEGEGGDTNLVIAEDISDRVLAQTKLKASELQYKTLFKTNPLPSFIYEVDSLRFLEVNDAALKYYGYSSEEFLKITLLDLHLPEDGELLKKAIAKNKTHTISAVPNWRQVNKNGEVLLADVSASSLLYNGINARLVVVNDMTERVKAEQELKETNRRFEFVSQATSDVIWDIDFKTNKLFLSENYHKVFGWKLAKDRSLGLEEAFAKCHPDDVKRMRRKLDVAINDHGITIWEEEFRYLRADGTYAYVGEKGFISRNEKGEAIRMAGTLEDISERKYQEELQSLELRVFEVSSVPGIHFHIVLKTLISGYENLHPGIFGSICLLGLSDEVEILAPKLTKEHCRQLRYFIEKQKGQLPYSPDLQKNIIISSFDSEDWKYGTDAANFYNWKTSWSVPVYHQSGELLAFITVFLDQSRKPSEQEQITLARMRNLLRILMVNHLSVEQIRVSNERYDNMLRATHDLVWDWNLESGNFYRNKEGLRKVYGIEDQKSIENVYSWMERIHPGDHIKVQRVINDILHATDQDTFDVEYRFKRDDGDYAFIYDRGVIVRNKEGKPLRMIGAAQNVTDRKKLEQELLQQELDKQKFISQATIDTQEQERREIGKELHDNVNQVLTTTKLYLDLSLTSPDLKDELITKSSKNIIYVINEIRQLSRSLMDPSIGDLGLLDSINDLVENINITRKLHVSLSAASDLEKCLDESQKLMIFRVIQEAMNNTIKYAQATSVQLSIKNIGGDIELLIVDDGKGFDISTVKKGAGLKNIQNRVYLTGGKLLIESASGKGCKISINFPIKQSI
jgi:PAS domain S-box-containing protein